MNRIKRLSGGERAFQLCNYLFLIILSFLTIYPFIHIASISFSTAQEAMREGLHLFPLEVSFSAYKSILQSSIIYSAYYNTIFRTAIGTVLKLAVSIGMAYGLSKSTFPFRGVWLKMLIFTMIFGAGLVPNYLLIKYLGLIDSVWSLILPGIISAFDIIIFINFFKGLPSGLEESAFIDGANDFVILWKIVVPLSLPAIATVGLWSAVTHWNSFLDAILYINSPERYPLQVLLRKILIEQRMLIEMGGTDALANQSSAVTEAATVMVSTLPILLVYPFVQKYFVKGVTLGSVKE